MNESDMLSELLVSRCIAGTVRATEKSSNIATLAGRSCTNSPRPQAWSRMA